MISINTKQTYIGIAAILITISIYATNFVFSRLSIQHGLTAYDLTAIRFLVAGSLLLPYLIKSGFSHLGGVGWSKGILLTCLVGSPYMIVFFSALQFAPAAHGGVLNPGIVPSIVFIGLVLLGKQVFSIKRLASLALILLGLVFVTSASFKLKGDILLGDVLFFISGLSWGVFTLLSNLWNIKPLQATAIVAVLSMVYLPIYFLFFYQGLAHVSLLHLGAQAIYQGVFNSIIALFCLSYAIQKLGAQTASLFSPAIPILTTIIAIPYLGEIPDFWQWLGIFLVACGMLFASLSGTVHPDKSR